MWGRKFPKIHAFGTTRILAGLARNFGKFQGSPGLQIAGLIYMVLNWQITTQRRNCEQEAEGIVGRMGGTGAAEQSEDLEVESR
ncbi:MAG: hypothetical protein CL882_03470 [Dehalococcoidia bacterium]|nr:hypothetical protein [Dehalococcoidia bacterium]